MSLSTPRRSINFESGIMYPVSDLFVTFTVEPWERYPVTHAGRHGFAGLFITSFTNALCRSPLMSNPIYPLRRNHLHFQFFFISWFAIHSGDLWYMIEIRADRCWHCLQARLKNLPVYMTSQISCRFWVMASFSVFMIMLVKNSHLRISLRRLFCVFRALSESFQFVKKKGKKPWRQYFTASGRYGRTP